MPGGSVNGRPFRESPDSFSKTGIPCGNPRRFHSQDVVRMEIGQRSASRPLDGPVEEIETEGERQLQTLLKKQLDTKLSMHDHFKQMKQFSSGSKFEASMEDLAGVRTLTAYTQHEEVEQYIEDLKTYGLTEEEILYKLQNEDKGQASGIGANPSYHRARLAEIEEKIERKKQQLSSPDTFSNMKPLTRHEMELEQTLSGSSHKNKFLHGVLIRQRDQDGSTDDPMNQLPDILQSITRHRDTGPGRRERRKRRREQKASKAIGVHEELEVDSLVRDQHKLTTADTCSCDGTKDASESDKCESTYMSETQRSGNSEASCSCMCTNTSDMISDPSKRSKVNCDQEHVSISEITESDSSTIATCLTKEEYLKTQGSQNKGGTSGIAVSGSLGTDRLLESEIESIPENAIRQYKLTTEQIKQLPRFQNYCPGEPSNVLYIKNLSNKVTETDLVSLFIRYQKQDGEKIIFKLMTGRMRGQAFVTFDSKDTASQALELVNGYDFKGKPIIIQYGRKTSS